ncbi:HD-GYP domain-containing protein [Desulfohalovibrio reitneri]|uniref:HD-GYP domain-containing protein n=1 Tax=Desulfohalovibrio reitneri TaxID=1307759 RepID=UPI00068AF957|nr:HD-GYP domain-containing protein [Desulfohalovibrio reitneri]
MSGFDLSPFLSRLLAPSSPSGCSPVCESIHEFAEAMGHAIDAKDRCTHFHSTQVAVLAQAVARFMGFSPLEAGCIHIAGHLHDIGKIGVPDAVLQKRGPLTEGEFAAIRRHPVIGHQIVSPITSLNGSTGIADMVLHHHERWDGRGYPHGLAGTAIPAGARVLAVADSFSAMTQQRPYRKGMGVRAALDEVEREAGSQFAPDVAEAFLRLAAPLLRDGAEPGASAFIERVERRFAG